MAASALGFAPCVVGAQGGAPGDSSRALLLERQIHPDAADTVVLKRGVVYQAELVGPGTPVFEPVAPRPRQALIVTMADGADGSRRFEVYAMQSGPHAIRLSDAPPEAVATLRLYQDLAATRRVAERHDRGFAAGLLVGAGLHTGYGLDPRDATDHSGGGDIEACVLLEAGDRFGACIGGGRQSIPSAGYTVGWLFIEGRVVIASRLLAGRRTELGATLRYAHGPIVGSPQVYPGLLGLGLFVRHHFAPVGRRRGLAVFWAWQHSRVISVPDVEGRSAERVTLGVTWAP
jgi:hypothetical protein